MVVHRWLGLVTAAFLFVSGVTGAVISWDHELDEWLNADLFEARTVGAPLPPLELAAKVEAADPRIRASFVSLQHEPGRASLIGVQPRVDPSTGKLFSPGYNQVFLDPVSGARLGDREWGAVSIARENLMPFLYKLHYSLHVPEMWGIDRWGVWLMGVIGLLWFIDCFVGFYLTLPRRAALNGTGTSGDARRTFLQRWKSAWRIKWRAGADRANYDVHRAFGLWTWGLLALLAFTAVSLNLYKELFWPVLNAVSTVTPGPFETRPRQPLHEPIAAKQGFAEIIATAQRDAQRRGWPEPVGSIFYAQHFGVFGVSFYEPGNDHGSGGMGVKTLYYDGADAEPLGDRVPWTGTAADVFVQLQFPVHSGRILGIPGRILISLMGLVVAVLSITGVVIWARKRRARVGAEQAGAAAIRPPSRRGSPMEAPPAADGRGAV